MAALKTFLLLSTLWSAIYGKEILSEPKSEFVFSYSRLNLTAEEIKTLQEQAILFEQEAKKENALKDNKAFACGQTNSKAEDRIAGGTETKVNEFPWQVWLLFTSGSNNYFCGGTLISDRWVLTAAQCIYGSSGAQIVLGSHYLIESNDYNRRVYTASRHIKHPNYNPNNLEADIALVQLPTTIPLNNFIRPICLPTSLDSDHVNDVAVFSGWGETRENSDFSPVLRKASATVISNSACSNYYQVVIAGNNICTSGNGNRGICAGDGGGPLSVVKSDGTHMQIGITSFRSSLGCTYGYPSGFTRLRPYLSWISSQTGIEIPSSTAASAVPLTTLAALSLVAQIFSVARFL